MSLLPLTLVKTKVAYTKIQNKDDLMFYVIEDTAEVFRGVQSLSESVKFVTEDPAQPAQGIIYILPTGEGKVWNGTAFKSIFSVLGEIVDGETQATAVSADAVKTYVALKVADKISALGFNTAVNAITYKENGEDKTLPLTAFLTGASYDSENGNLSFNTAIGDPIVVNLPKDNFVKAGVYDEASKSIVLTLQNDATVTIPAGDLIDILADSDTVSITTNEETKAKSFNVKISDTEGNSLTKDAKGLFVPPVNPTVEGATANELVATNADGTLKPSLVKAGLDSLAGVPDASTLATEAAVSKALSFDTIEEVNDATATAGENITVDGVEYKQYALKDSSDAAVSVAKTVAAYVKINGISQTLSDNANVLLPANSEVGDYNVVAKLIEGNKLYQSTITIS